MKSYDKYERVIATKERSAGNSEVGDMWTETKSFTPDTPVSNIIEWGRNCGGRLSLTIDETGANDDDLEF